MLKAPEPPNNLNLSKFQRKYALTDPFWCQRHGRLTWALGTETQATTTPRFQYIRHVEKNQDVTHAGGPP